MTDLDAFWSNRMTTEQFIFKEFVALENPTGMKAAGLSEMLAGLRSVDDNVLYNHLFLSHLRQRHQRWEYPNDFARWAAYSLNDFVLAEALANYSPFERKDMSVIRDDLMDILDDHMWDYGGREVVRRGREFYFNGATSFVFDSRYRAGNLHELRDGLKKVSLSSLYYHYFEACIRQRGTVDDISFWIEHNLNLPDLVEQMRGWDYYFLSLSDLRDKIVRVLGNYLANNHT